MVIGKYSYPFQTSDLFLSGWKGFFPEKNHIIINKPDAHKVLMLLPPVPPQLQAATAACKAAISVWTFWKMKINCSLCVVKS